MPLSLLLDRDDTRDRSGHGETRGVPGKTTLTSRLPPRRAADPVVQSKAATPPGPTVTSPQDNPFALHLAGRANLAPSGGEALPGALRGTMERSFGADFASVRVHRDSAQATGLGAHAFAAGDALHFAPGQYDPAGASGRELIGHELSHVVQQAEGRAPATAQAHGVAINQDAGLEREADEEGARAARGEPASSRSTGGPPRIPTAARVLQGVFIKLSRERDPIDQAGDHPSSAYGRRWYVVDGVYYLASAFPELAVHPVYECEDEAQGPADDIGSKRKDRGPEPVVEGASAAKKPRLAEPAKPSLVLDPEQAAASLVDVERPGDIVYTPPNPHTMHHKLPRHVLEAWFMRAIQHRDLELMQKLVVIANRPHKQYLAPAPEGGMTVVSMLALKTDVTFPRWDLFEGPLADRRGDDARDKLDGHFNQDGTRTPRSTVAQQILDIGIDSLGVGDLQAMMQQLADQGMSNESPIVPGEWRNECGDEMGSGKGLGLLYQWADPQNEERRGQTDEARARREREKKARVHEKSTLGMLARMHPTNPEVKKVIYQAWAKLGVAGLPAAVKSPVDRAGYIQSHRDTFTDDVLARALAACRLHHSVDELLAAMKKLGEG